MNPSDYRSWVGPEKNWDIAGAHQFSMLVKHGLRQHHRLCDIGCGSLRAGRFLMVYLDPGNYVGFDPHIDYAIEALEQEMGMQFAGIRKVTVTYQFPWTTDRFDYLLAHSIFTHAPASLVEDYLVKCRHAIKDGGVFLFTFNPGPDTEMTTWQYPGYLTHAPETIEELAKKTGWHLEFLEDEHFSGIQRWVRAIPGR